MRGAELFAVFLCTGIKGRSAADLVRDLFFSVQFVNSSSAHVTHKPFWLELLNLSAV